jgi:GH3 auxin-responsive promoter
MDIFKNIIMPTLAPILHKAASLAATRFDRRDPVAVQQLLFKHLLLRGQGTWFGQDHGFRSLINLPFEKAYDRYRRIIPIRTYADFWQEYFISGFETVNGQPHLKLDNVTWPGRIRLFCETSGTTAPTKYIPFTQEMFTANRRAARDLLVNYLAAVPESRLFQGRFVYLSGSTELNNLGPGIESGDMSAITLRYAPAVLRPFIAPSPQVAALTWDAKMEALTDLLLTDRDITGISGVPPWLLLILERVRHRGGKPLPVLLPNLELIIHGGTSIAPYRREFETLFGDRPPQFLELLPASEGFTGFQIKGENDMRFTPWYGVFFEFVPFSCLDGQGGIPADAPALTLSEVRAGERYALILSTCAGLWRYHIGDTIRFTSLAPLAFEFTGRDRFLDRFEEKVTQAEVDRAVADLNEQIAADIVEFMVGPEILQRRHLWVVAVKGVSPDAERLGQFLDERLMTFNADYASFRRQGRINPPRIVTVSEETIYHWSRHVRGKLGGQSKISHVDPTMEGNLVRSLADFGEKENQICFDFTSADSEVLPT